MADISHVWGSDLALSSTGDLLLAEGSEAGRQRVLRRLLSNPADLLYHLAYGAGLPRQIGEVTDPLVLEGIVRTQMLDEPVVVQDPPPGVTIARIFGGVTIGIGYQDEVTGAPVALAFTVER